MITTKQNYFMSMAFLASRRSKDPRTEVGATVAFPDDSFVTGYNGLPSGFNDDILNTDLKHDLIIHAEINALKRAGLERCRREKPDLYVTFRPCPKCAIEIIDYGIETVYYYSDYVSETCNNEDLLDLVCNNGIEGFHSGRLELIKYDTARDGVLLYVHEHMGKVG